MKVVLLNSSDTEGGAARAAYRLHQGLQGIGVSSQMLVKNKKSGDSSIISSQNTITNKLDKIISTLYNSPLRLYPERRPVIFSTEWLPDSLDVQISKIKPDIINLHWVCGGYLQVESIPRFNQPLVWTLHDMWPFTGGCHYSEECDRYTESCGSCPQLHSSKDWDMSRWVWRRKAKSWKNLNLTLVSPSVWLAKCASSSSLLKDYRVEVIPYGINTQKYKPINREWVREILNLPQDKQIVLFGCASGTGDRWKGFNLLVSALQSLSKSGWSDRIELLVFGSSEPSNPIELGFKAHYLGKFADDISLAIVYAAADVFVAPSIYDNLPNTVMEAAACGIPSVGFKIGGMPDLIDHCSNGYLAKPYETEDLARGIAWVLEDSERHQKLCRNAREKVEAKFTLEVQAREYQKLYEEVLYTAK
ncbi:glycosyltransferase family 4 protein [Tychonema sp. LEGE 07199]|uniref:glycosyltransferase family 4 protein n=1 Tax=unclassified Tychonema TaxID=2642144 RepID=UPI001880995E|nr:MULTISPECIES: glycosyltransferase family 4 protein [unclassified Tychonema]MBE9120737.1 glycosyltransferase family 4 protein [Tychonema sp. LEGE 07199]MBE9133383.1 glycosyltransferase family 4 protein [Tychonema sp. LEGE 07196]MBE9162767.1 glycosyltransferase family 4 protein [Tychonema sp. LEGE 06208]